MQFASLSNLSTVAFSEPMRDCMFSKTSSMVPMDEACRKRIGAFDETWRIDANRNSLMISPLLVVWFLRRVFERAHLNPADNQRQFSFVAPLQRRIWYRSHLQGNLGMLLEERKRWSTFVVVVVFAITVIENRTVHLQRFTRENWFSSFLLIKENRSKRRTNWDWRSSRFAFHC